jgi:hypothetical protein
MAVGAIRMRALAALLSCLWVSVGVALLAAYRPGGPSDATIGIAAFVPALIATGAIAWPPATSRHRSGLAILWVGITAALLLAPLLGSIVAVLDDTGRRTLLPSVESAYAWFLALAATTVYGALGLARRILDRAAVDRAGAAVGTAVAAIVTVLVAGLTGATTAANQVALRERPPAVQDLSWGPADMSTTLPGCRSEVRLGSTARLAAEGEALVDGGRLGRVTLAGVRSGGDERWQGTLESGGATQGADFALIDGALRLSVDGRPLARPALGAMGGTLDAAVARLLATDGLQAVEDLGVELVEGVRARHCRTAVDGPAVLGAFVPARWLAALDLGRAPPPLEAWRGDVDWWLFVDGQLGLASVSLGGYAGDAWPDMGVRGELRARLTALDRGAPHAVEPPVP